MSNLIADPSAPLIREPKHPYWDAPLTRREGQLAINEMAENDQELSNRADTTHIVLNFICERLNITRGEIEAYVERKKAEIKAIREAEAKAARAAEAANEQSNG